MMTQKKFMRRCVMASIFYVLIKALVLFGGLQNLLPPSAFEFVIGWGVWGLNVVFLFWLFKRFSVTRVSKLWLFFIPILMVWVAPLVYPVTWPYLEFMREAVFHDFWSWIGSSAPPTSLETIKYAFLMIFIPGLINQLPSLLVLFLVSLNPNFPENGESGVLRILRKMVLTSDRDVSNTATGQISLA